MQYLINTTPPDLEEVLADATEAAPPEGDPMERAERAVARAAEEGAEMLHLRGLGLRSLPAALDRVAPQLTVLDLSRNELAELPEALVARLTALKGLNLRDNALSTLPPSLASLSRLAHLNVEGNPLAGTACSGLLVSAR